MFLKITKGLNTAMVEAERSFKRLLQKCVREMRIALTGVVVKGMKRGGKMISVSSLGITSHCNYIPCHMKLL